ncbi:MAG: DUF262 domain-containing protein [Desulfobacteraceae bacterium]|nr:DUF262 domain-containing protein [Desulfobacteraceae bacterium]MBC2754576.1 DUF262 domain-containing protein [Desulfobacteraceae bacterium]
MKKPNVGINFKNIGIGDALNQYSLSVPPNQRSYAWEAQHVEKLLEDFAKALSEDDPTYFLGTIVLTHGETERLEVADGQQRLATVSILIASIRDYLFNFGDNEKRAANKYTDKHLLEYNEIDGIYTPKLRLNTRDSDYFNKWVLFPPDDKNRNKCDTSYSSHERIAGAKKVIDEYVQKIVAPYGDKEKPRELYKWISFLSKFATVIVIEVPDHINAYTMFETLNDRGLRASQTDILKNFLFATAKDRLDEVQEKWHSMVGIIESEGNDDLILTHIRHAWITKNGPTVERELAEKVKKRIGSMQHAVDIVSYFETSANYYVALLSPLDHSTWSGLGKSTRYHIHVITNILRIMQIRPLMLAIAFKFDGDEKRKAFKLLLSLSVRFLIFGVSGSGGLEKNYGSIARNIMDEKITKSKQIVPAMTVNVPSNKAFEDAFKNAKVNKTYLARYYLRAIEIFKRGEQNPEFGGIDDTMTYNLEHVLPLKLSDRWNIEPEVASAFQKRLGNMVLLNPTQNTQLGNGSFDDKRKILEKSTLITTQDAGRHVHWTPDVINERQKELSKVVAKIWTIKT